MSKKTKLVASHGYSGRTLSQKLGIKSATCLLHVNAPPNYSDLLDDIWSALDARAPTIRDADITHVFCETTLDLQNCVSDIAPHIQPKASLWVSWRKGKRDFTKIGIENYERAQHV